MKDGWVCGKVLPDRHCICVCVTQSRKTVNGRYTDDLCSIPQYEIIYYYDWHKKHKYPWKLQNRMVLCYKILPDFHTPLSKYDDEMVEDE